MTFLFIDKIHLQDYFIRYSSEDIPCIILQIDQLWIRCIINRSDPLKILSRTLPNFVNIELIFISMENLILPSKFLEDNRYNLIIIDTTKNFHLKQINISSELFVNIFSTKIYFILHECGHPILHIIDHRFRYHSNEELFITYHNRSRTVTIENYFSEECLLEQEIDFQNVYDFHWSRNSKKMKQIYWTKLWINTSIFSMLILLITILMCLAQRKESEKIRLRSCTPSEISTTVVSTTM